MAEEVTYHNLVSAFSSFLTVSIHTILYERSIYPDTSFISARKYNYPVRQNRHPRVCKWITDAVSAVEAELLKCAVDRVYVVIYDSQDRPLERFMFDVSRFPQVPAAELNTRLERVDEEGVKVAVPPGDMEEQFRATMSRLSGCGTRLGKIPSGCTFTVAVELKDNTDPPIGHPQPWIPVQPSLQKGKAQGSGGTRSDGGSADVGPKTTPVRSVSAGEMMFEVWIEESKAKFEEMPSSDTSSKHA